MVVDDGLMGITHVLRGDDLLLCTPRQIWLFEVLGLPVPEFAHVPLLYGQDGNRLSKRHGSLAADALRQRGVRAEEVIGYLAHLGGLIPNKEPVKARELVSHFSLEKLPKEPVILGWTAEAGE